MGWIFFIALLVIVFLIADFSVFAAKSKGPEGYKTDAGGVLFVQGNTTYYQMPSGARRKIADYAFDLTPGSRDLNMFLGILDKANREMKAEASNKRKAAVKNMIEVAKDAR